MSARQSRSLENTTDRITRDVIRGRAVLFDLDGTLVNSLQDLAESVNAVLSEHGAEPHRIDAYRHFVGEGITELARRALGDLADPRLVEQFATRVRQVYGTRWDRKTRPYPGIVSVITALNGLRTPLAVLSNKPQQLTEKVVQRFFPRDAFATVLGAEAGFARKPDPAGALEVARRCALPASSFVYVGDTATDMQTAKAAGMYAVGALWGFRDATELQAAGADALIPHPGAIVGMVTAG